MKERMLLREIKKKVNQNQQVNPIEKGCLKSEKQGQTNNERKQEKPKEISKIKEKISRKKQRRTDRKKFEREKEIIKGSCRKIVIYIYPGGAMVDFETEGRKEGTR